MTDYEPVPLIKAAYGDPDFERVMNIVGAMLSGAAIDQGSDDLDPRHHTALTMAAAGVLAGYLGGASIIAGTANDKDKRRMGDMLLTNFRNGIQIGKENALRTLTDSEFAGHA